MTDLEEASHNTDSIAKSSFLSPFGWYSLALLIVSVATLVPSYLTPLVTDPGILSVQIIVHGAAFIGWYILVVVQSSLAFRKQLATHKRIGYISIVFAALLMVSGALMLIGVMNSFDPEWTDAYLASRTSFVWAILHTLIFFCGSYISAIANRTRRQVHKRLILMASLSMVAPSITRVAYLPLIPIDGTAFTLLATYLYLAIPMLIDRHYEGRVHPVFKFGIPVYAITQILAIGLLPATTFGQKFAFGL